MVNKLVDDYSVEIENICLDLLSRPDTPVVPLKYFIESLKSNLKADQETIDLIKNGTDQEDIRQHVETKLLSVAIML